MDEIMKILAQDVRGTAAVIILTVYLIVMYLKTRNPSINIEEIERRTRIEMRLNGIDEKIEEIRGEIRRIEDKLGP
jgi:hypothetical protein